MFAGIVGELNLRPLLKYKDLRDFIAQLEQLGELKRVGAEVDPRLEMTEICDRVLRAGGPAILFEKPKAASMPVLGNLFGTPGASPWAYGTRVGRGTAPGRRVAGVPEGTRAAQGGAMPGTSCRC